LEKYFYKNIDNFDKMIYNVLDIRKELFWGGFGKLVVIYRVNLLADYNYVGSIPITPIKEP